MRVDRIEGAALRRLAMHLRVAHTSAPIDRGREGVLKHFDVKQRELKPAPRRGTSGCGPEQLA